jgi:hypothetical protein
MHDANTIMLHMLCSLEASMVVDHLFRSLVQLFDTERWRTIR